MKKVSTRAQTVRTAITVAKERGLRLEQEEFCRLYATDREYFGNGVQAFIAAYKVDMTKRNAYNNARARAAQLLAKRNVLNRIDELLELDALNDQRADRTLAFWMEQRAHPTVSMDAVKEYNKLKGRITEKIEKKVTMAGIIAHVYGEADKRDKKSKK